MRSLSRNADFLKTGSRNEQLRLEEMSRIAGEALSLANQINTSAARNITQTQIYNQTAVMVWHYIYILMITG